MTFRNDGQGDSNILQNQFTAYLQVALKRKKSDYLAAKNKRRMHESSLESNDYLAAAIRNLEDDLSYEFQIENDVLLQALESLSSRERLILFARALDDSDFHVLAREYGLSYKGVSTIFYRLRDKIRKHMGGV